MALSEARYNLDASLNVDDLTHEDLYAFERACRQTGSAVSDDSVFAFATGQPANAPLHTPQEREEARSFLLEAFLSAGMKGELTDLTKPLPPVISRGPYDAGADDESDVFSYGVR
jgi:hypothetical protein